MLKSFLFGFFAFYCLNVYPRPWQVGFQEPATAMMSGIIDLHHDIMAILMFILGFVSILLLTILLLFSERKVLNRPYIKLRLATLHRQNYYSGHGITYHTLLETIWTIIPTLILLVIATPSFALIYALDEVMHPELTVRVAGRQWYWNYEYPDGFKQIHKFNRLPPLVGYSTEDVLKIVANRLQLDDTTCFGEAAADFDPYDGQSEETCIYPFQAAIKPYDALDWEYTPHFIWLMEASKADFRWNDLASLDYNRRAGDFTRGPSEGYLLADPDAAIVRMKFPILRFNSYMVPTEDLPFGTFRLLEVDKRLVLPVDTTIRFLVTSDDVLHSWTVPSFGIKVDAVPGRTNEYYLMIQKCGVYYGQCSEICGVNHGFMPIKVEVVPAEIFRLWYLSSLVGEFDEDSDIPPMYYVIDKDILFNIVDEIIPYFCDLHGYEPIELHRKVVQGYFDGGPCVTHFLLYRHVIANMICNAFFKQDGYTLKPTRFALDTFSLYISWRCGLLPTLGFTADYVDKYCDTDRDITYWRRTLPKNFYEREQQPGFASRSFS